MFLSSRLDVLLSLVQLKTASSKFDQISLEAMQFLRSSLLFVAKVLELIEWSRRLNWSYSQWSQRKLPSENLKRSQASQKLSYIQLGHKALEIWSHFQRNQQIFEIKLIWRNWVKIFQ